MDTNQGESSSSDSGPKSQPASPDTSADSTDPASTTPPEGTATTNEPSPERKKRAILSAWASGARQIGMAFLIMGVIFGVQNWLANSSFAEYLRNISFPWFEALLPGTTRDRMPVVVVDISLISGGTLAQPMKREALKLVIDQLHQAQAKVVGIDIDFSPTSKGWVVRDAEKGGIADPEFFQYCLDMSKDMPVFLGVYRTRKQPPESRMNLPKFNVLGAYIGTEKTPDGTTKTRVQRFYPDSKGTPVLPSMGYALALAYSQRAGVALPQSEGALDDFVEPLDGNSRGQVGNFSKVDEIGLREGVYLNTDKSGNLEVAGITPHYVRDRIVLIGDLDLKASRMDNSNDSFFAPGSDRLPGVLYHAVAAYTFAFEPVYEFKERTRVWLDLLLGCVFLSTVALQVYFEHSAKPRGKVQRFLEQRALLIAMLMLIGIAIASMRAFSVMWLDALWISLGLFAHYLMPQQVKELFPRLGVLHSEESSK